MVIGYFMKSPKMSRKEVTEKLASEHPQLCEHGQIADSILATLRRVARKQRVNAQKAKSRRARMETNGHANPMLHGIDTVRIPNSATEACRQVVDVLSDLNIESVTITKDGKKRWEYRQVVETQ